MLPPVFRFAPSPNGYLHLGHAFSAILNADMAQLTGGRLLLRIEDIDSTRCRPDYEAAIYEDLAWLGLQWEAPAQRQSERSADYRAALGRLDTMGLIYPSFETRAEIARLIAACETQGAWPRDPDGALLYPGTAKMMSDRERKSRMDSGDPYALRLDMQAALALVGDLSWIESGASPAGATRMVGADPAAWGDVILARKETPTSYHLAVVVDDAAQGITEVVRGRDLFYATAVHRLLQALLGLPQPRYYHHRLILDADGNKLSKSTRSTGLRELRTDGVSAADIRRMVGLD